MSPPPLDLFRQACGAAGPLRLECLYPGREAPESRTFEPPFALLGRDPSNDLCLAADDISSRHAYLQVLGGKLFFVDLGSRMGLHWEERPCAFGWLDPGQALRIQSSTVRLLPPADGPGSSDTWTPCRNPLDSRPADSPLTPGVTVEITGGPAGPLRWRINRLLTLVGTARECKLRLRDPHVSRFHCSLVHTPLGVWVIDLLSSRGTVLNGERVRWAKLEEGDRLAVGPFRIRANYDPTGPDAASGPVLPEPTTALVPGAGALAGPGLASLVPVPATGLLPRDQALLQPVLEQFQIMQQQTMDQFHQTLLMMAQMFTSLHREQMELVREELDRVHKLTHELQELRTQLTQQTAHPSPPPSGPGTREPRRGEPEGPQAPPGPPSRPATSAPPVAPAAGNLADPSIHVWLSRRIAELDAERQGSWQKIMHFLIGK